MLAMQSCTRTMVSKGIKTEDFPSFGLNGLFFFYTAKGRNPEIYNTQLVHLAEHNKPTNNEMIIRKCEIIDCQIMMSMQDVVAMYL